MGNENSLTSDRLAKRIVEGDDSWESRDTAQLAGKWEMVDESLRSPTQHAPVKSIESFKERLGKVVPGGVTEQQANQTQEADRAYFTFEPLPADLRCGNSRRSAWNRSGVILSREQDRDFWRVVDYKIRLANRPVANQRKVAEAVAEANPPMATIIRFKKHIRGGTTPHIQPDGDGTCHPSDFLDFVQDLHPVFGKDFQIEKHVFAKGDCRSDSDSTPVENIDPTIQRLEGLVNQSRTHDLTRRVKAVEFCITRSQALERQSSDNLAELCDWIGFEQVGGHGQWFARGFRLHLTERMCPGSSSEEFLAESRKVVADCTPPAEGTRLYVDQGVPHIALSSATSQNNRLCRVSPTAVVDFVEDLKTVLSGDLDRS